MKWVKTADRPPDHHKYVLVKDSEGGHGVCGDSKYAVLKVHDDGTCWMDEECCTYPLWMYDEWAEIEEDSE